jgi:hypothetical protein
MNASHTTSMRANKPSSTEESKPGFRTKTIATRLSPGELAEVECAAEQAGKPLSEWLRETALTAARRRPADPTELVLAELWAMRHLLLNLSYAGAQATAEGASLSPQSILKIRERTNARKLVEARKILAEFFALEDRGGGDRS